MPKNSREYYYPYPRIRWESDIYRWLAEEAKQTGMTIADLLVLRSTDYYKGVQTGVIAAQPIRKITKAEGNDATANAAAAAAAWNEED